MLYIYKSRIKTVVWPTLEERRICTISEMLYSKLFIKLHGFDTFN